tara:strand:+ start:1385 stop:1621 length:237 start_codon:yes stop_codon:yes gene_type:complete
MYVDVKSIVIKVVLVNLPSSHFPCAELRVELFEFVDIGIESAKVLNPVILARVLVRAESIPPDTPTIRLFAGLGILLT